MGEIKVPASERHEPLVGGFNGYKKQVIQCATWVRSGTELTLVEKISNSILEDFRGDRWWIPDGNVPSHVKERSTV